MRGPPHYGGVQCSAVYYSTISFITLPDLLP
jgi:hypothetical protein